MYMLVSDGLISLHVQKEAEAHITRCITMKRNSQTKARTVLPPLTESYESEDHIYSNNEEVRMNRTRFFDIYIVIDI